MIMTYEQLLTALKELRPSQLKMSVIISEDCDENGDAKFFGVDSLTLAMNPDVESAACDVFDDIDQPILLYNGVDL